MEANEDSTNDNPHNNDNNNMEEPAIKATNKNICQVELSDSNLEEQRHGDMDKEGEDNEDGEETEDKSNHRNALTTQVMKPFASGFSIFLKKLDENVSLAKSPSVCSPSPMLTRKGRQKTIMNTFRLTERAKYDKESYQLYHDTISNRGKELYDSAVSAFDDGKFETCLSFLRKAMIMTPNNPELFTLCGETYLQLCDFKSAILNYKRVCILQPENEESFSRLAFIYYLLSQSYYDEHMYLDALVCATRAAEMKPKNTGYHSRRIACLVSLKRHKECLQLVNKRLEIESKNPNLYVLRARLHLLFCNPTLSYYDINEALSIDPNNSEARFMNTNLRNNAEYFKQMAIKFAMSGETKEAISKISQAIDSNPSVTEYHILRGGLHRRNLDFNAAVDDILLAMGKTEYSQNDELYVEAQQQLLLIFNDFAVDCFRKGYYEEAIVLLEKSIQGEKNNSVLYINRGDCFYKMEYLHFAMLDYQQAQEIDGRDKNISLRLSVVYNELGIIEYHERNYYRAEDYFSLAISYNCENPTLYLSRARTRYMQQNVEEAQVDIISGLYLDRSSKHILSMFSRLFSGKEVDEVLSSEYGVLVCEALNSVIADEQQTDNLTGYSQNNLPLPDITATSATPRLVVNQKLQQCMESNEFNILIIKGKKKLNDLVESIIQSRQDLTYTGPKLPGVGSRSKPFNKGTSKTQGNQTKSGKKSIENLDKF